MLEKRLAHVFHVQSGIPKNANYVLLFLRGSGESDEFAEPIPLAHQVQVRDQRIAYGQAVVVVGWFGSHGTEPLAYLTAQ